MQKFIVLYILFFLVKGSFSQDSVVYSKNFRLYEGIYTSYQELRFNWPIDRDKIITKIPKDQLDFYSKLTKEEFIEYKERDGSVAKIKSDKIWGYCQNNIVFVYQENDFYRIPVFGAISNFIGTVEVTNYSNGYNPYTQAPINTGNTYKTREIRQFLFNFYTGEIAPYTVETFEEFIKNDVVLYNEFSGLRKRKKKNEAFKYLRLYNEKHPIYFPKG